MYQQKVSLDQISGLDNWQGRKADGRWIGMLRASGDGGIHLVAALEQLRGEGRLEDCSVPELINRLVENGHAPQVQYISGHWMDINNLEDLQLAGDFAYGRNS